MARRRRPQEAGLVYHVTSRRCEHGEMFCDEEDNLRFLELLGEVASLFALRVYAYCLMINHFHLVFRTTGANIGQAMHRLNGTFANWWNWKYRHVGHLLERRYAGQVIADDVYFLNACRYTVLNPVRAKRALAANPADWRWSSYRATAGLEAPPPWLDVSSLLAHFGDDRGTATAAYRLFIEGRPVGAVREFPLLAEEVLRAAFRAHTARLTVTQQRSDQPTLAELFANAPRRQDRDSRIVDAFRSGYTMVSIGRYLHLHESTIKRVLVRAGVLRPRAAVLTEPTDTSR